MVFKCFGFNIFSHVNSVYIYFCIGSKHTSELCYRHVFANPYPLRSVYSDRNLKIGQGERNACVGIDYRIPLENILVAGLGNAKPDGISCTHD